MTRAKCEREVREEIPVDDCLVKIEVSQKTKVVVHAKMRELLRRLRADGATDYASMDDLALEELAADLACRAIDEAIEDAATDASDLDHFGTGESLAEIIGGCLSSSVADVIEEYAVLLEDRSPPSTAAVEATATNVVAFRPRREK